MSEHHDANARMQNGMRDARTHVNREKSRDGIEPPRTVAEQVDELESEGGDGHRRRDPLKATERQQVERDDGVGGAWIATSQRANDLGGELGDSVEVEKAPDRQERNVSRG
jgi:hypothetical protein